MRSIDGRCSSDGLFHTKIVGANEALDLGLVHEVVDDESLEARVMEMATEIANGPVAIRLLKRSIYNAADMTFEQSLDEIASKTAISDHHPDARALLHLRKATAKFNAFERYR